ncbi:MAG: glycosyltransferase family 39 protein [Rhodopseudomonas palustris]|uniref:Glycosyltransferase family 39 protein n=1 Tax=Rhodopseudomonas palustris TaxID=1076 RepID=A0A933RY18_RHOPL|nr:glycosyltransferase family 39 protein [Rhodopseudomonas palustris]
MDRTLSRSGFSIGLMALVLAALVLPVAMAALVFPTPLYDTRELVAWGRHFPLLTPVHPPVMVWVGGAVDYVFGPSGTAIVLVNQICLAIGLAYLYATLRLLVERAMAAYIVALTTASFYVVFGPLSWALNADILQLTSWPAILFHLLRGRSTDRWLHWILLGVWAAIAALTKYNAVVLFTAMAVGIAVVPAFRGLLRRPGPYVALLIGGLLFLPHAVAALRYGTTIAYGERHFTGFGSVADTARRLGLLLAGYLPLLLPGVVVLAIAVRRRMIVWRVPRFAEASDELKFIVVVDIAMFAVLLVLIGVFGLEYIARYGAPFAELAVLALAPLFRWIDGRRDLGMRQTVQALAVLYAVLAVGASVAYLFFVSHSGLQEPTAQAARLILSDWNSKYTCGPGYFLGDRQTVYGIGIAAGPDGDSLTIGFIPKARWFDTAKLETKGAVLVYALPQVPGHFAKAFPGMTMSAEKQISVPVLRTHTGKTKDYFYRFVAPKACSG